MNPYRYRLARQSPDFKLIERTAGETAGPNRDPLSGRQLVELTQTLEQVEALMGEPQDVEWAYQNNALYLLQTRPVTAAPCTATAPTPFAFEAPFDAEWTRANHPEVLPELPSPLFTSLMERTQDRGINFFTRMGLNISGLGPYIKCFYGRPYLNLSLIKRVLAQLGFSPIPLLAMAGYVKANTISDPFRINWSKLWQARKPFKNLLGQAFTLGRTVDDYRQTVDEVIARLQKPLPSPPEALQQFKLRERVYGDLIGAGLVLVSALTGLTVLAA
ncbi:MAG: PEP/pyruvate-binding domain-containing protein, partial [Anaerolineae bacterium]